MIKKLSVVYWLLAIVIAFVYLPAGAFKLMSAAEMLDTFTRFGYPLWFMYFIGVCEILGSLGVLIGPFINAKLPRLAAAGLMVIMIGAIVSHLIFDPPTAALMPAFMIAVLSTFIYVETKRHA